MTRQQVQDIFHSHETDRVTMNGFLGQRIEICIRNGVMTGDPSLYVVPFRDKTDEGGGFAGEFWGKWFTSAVLAYRHHPVQPLRTLLDRAVQDLLATQEQSGRISSYKTDFGDWDIWGRKYVLLGLLAYYDLTSEGAALEAAVRAADQLIDIAGPGKIKLTESGLSLLEALSSCSILEPLAVLYQRCGHIRFLRFAEYLVSLWSEPNTYTPKGIRLIEGALDGTDPIQMASPKGYEMMSCYEGLCELYRATGERKYLEAAVQFGHSVRKKEIMIVGSGSSGELWCDGANRQTELLEQPMETCVTATWIKFCYQLLRLTGDSIWADEMEITLYNALLSAMVPDGSWWAYFSPLSGERVPSHIQVPLVNCSCCSANGPRGLLTAPRWAVMHDEFGLIVNLYAEGKWKGKVRSGIDVELMQETGYPNSDRIRITVVQPEAAVYTIALRVPHWSRQSELAVNGEEQVCTPGAYARITREWKNGDVIVLKLDMRGRVVQAPGSLNHKAVMRGPVVLALDSRIVEPLPECLWLHDASIHWRHNRAWKLDYALLDKADAGFAEYIDLEPYEDKPEGVWMAYRVRFLLRPTHFTGHQIKSVVMCDYASAGNRFAEDHLFRVWLPQPLFFGSAFPGGTWPTLVHTDYRPTIPVMERKPGLE